MAVCVAIVAGFSYWKGPERREPVCRQGFGRSHRANAFCKAASSGSTSGKTGSEAQASGSDLACDSDRETPVFRAANSRAVVNTSA
jgi:hypothetical protein